ncbi:Sulfate-binding protein [Clostridium bornimense]|uniref:Sulfate-binding protein n=1 Tax=Clostridium bornimense TaxID=1216932 RepID=W6S207_9CLOT|nr:sulfate ABC transporter substrate-binding protein [Clostridium bornimense]CDM69904.1 Sulfate-binding protein [Clostridium bornimense]
MKIKKVVSLLLVAIIGGTLLTSCSDENKNKDTVEITNVSYDPTRELYEAYNKEFQKYYKDKTNKDVVITQSHGGSGKQARAVIEGNEADVVTLALGYDISAIEKAGLIESGWQSKFDKNSSPYTSTIVFLVRKGNPKNINDWDDLVREDVGIITPNPKTSGGARWNYLAAWAYSYKKNNGDEEKVKKYMKDLFGNVLVLDSGARGATTTFVENGQGDVLLAWENEAYLSLKEHPDEFEIVTPSISMLAEPPVAVVDEVVDKKGTREVATEYLEYLYSDIGQRIAGENYYRPTNEEIAKEFSDVFNLDMELINIDDKIFGGWDKAQKEHFDDGGIFDEIYDGEQG